jgi:hypothetical protein
MAKPDREVDDEGRRWQGPAGTLQKSPGKCPNGHKLKRYDSLVLTKREGGWRYYYCPNKKCMYSV